MACLFGSCVGLGFGRSHKVHPCRFVVVFSDRSGYTIDNLIVTKTGEHTVNICTGERSYDCALATEDLDNLIKLICDFCIPANFAKAVVISAYSQSAAQFAEYSWEKIEGLVECIKAHLRIFVITRKIKHVHYPAL